AAGPRPDELHDQAPGTAGRFAFEDPLSVTGEARDGEGVRPTPALTLSLLSKGALQAVDENWGAVHAPKERLLQYQLLTNAAKNNHQEFVHTSGHSFIIRRSSLPWERV
ncbi:MAG: hypothetical protein AB7P20_24070, partial [Rhizobiaceae bacterium]